MAKLIAWLVLIFVVLLAFRLINVRNARLRRSTGDAKTGAKIEAQPMVRCANCGVFLPRVEAKGTADGGFACADGQCAKH